MNPQIFNTFGYLSILLWLLMPVLWAVHFSLRPRRWYCHYALVAGAAALICATINSETYVNRIQPDYSEQRAQAQARQEAARRAAEAERAGEVAQVRFAEDDADDYLDLGGLEEADRKYLERFDDSATPEWKKQKKERAASRQQDDSVEALLDEGEEVSGMDVSGLDVENAETEPVTMTEANLLRANRLDALNLKVIRWLLLIGIGLVIVDYLRRLNVYQEAYLPLPLPSSLVNGMTAVAALETRPATPRRSMPKELAWLIRRGDAFIYISDDPARASALPERMYRLPGKKVPVDVLSTDGPAAPLDPEFLFEALWYNRASFVVQSPECAQTILEHFVEKLRRRRETRARVRQTVHLVWDSRNPMPKPLRDELLALAGATGWSVFEAGNRTQSTQRNTL